MNRRTALYIWHFVIVLCAAWSAFSFLNSALSLRTFTVQVNIAITLYYIWSLFYQMRRGDRHFEGLRGAIVVYAIFMGIMYIVFGGAGSLSTLQSWLAHIITPLFVLLDWIIVSKATLKWWHPFAWLSYPVLYLVMTLIVASFIRQPYLRYQYSFFNPQKPHFAIYVVIYMLALVGVGYLVIWARALGKTTASTSSDNHHVA